LADPRARGAHPATPGAPDASSVAPSFDRASFTAELATRRLGHMLVVRAETDSTNDDAWDAGATRGADGIVVVADRQVRGRGRDGRVWHQAPGRGLAMSVLLHTGCDSVPSTIPLVAGLAVARALDTLGLDAELKWPNDVLARGRKLAGVLCESRRADREAIVVIGVGVNVHERAEDFPSELRDTATSLALEGVETTRERVAARFLNALEPLWAEEEEGDRAAVIDAWRARARFWGRTVRASTPQGIVEGVARSLDPDGALVLRVEGSRDVRVVAGDVSLGPGATAR
jgi:BirA family biotin operon repressor/biotin-[acetyl-CoA-carboxylase] ligase